MSGFLTAQMMSFFSASTTRAPPDCLSLLPFRTSASCLFNTNYNTQRTQGQRIANKMMSTVSKKLGGSCSMHSSLRGLRCKHCYCCSRVQELQLSQNIRLVCLQVVLHDRPSPGPRHGVSSNWRRHKKKQCTGQKCALQPGV